MRIQNRNPTTANKLNEMLDNVNTTRGEKFVTGDVYEIRLVTSTITLNDVLNPSIA